MLKKITLATFLFASTAPLFAMPYIPSVKEQTALAQIPDVNDGRDPTTIQGTRGYTRTVKIKNNTVFVSDNENPNKYIFKVTLSNTIALGDGPVYSDGVYYKSVLAGEYNSFYFREVKYRVGEAGHEGTVWSARVSWEDGKFTGSTSGWSEAGWSIGASNGAFIVENRDGGWGTIEFLKWMDADGNRIVTSYSGSVRLIDNPEIQNICFYHNGASKGCIDYSFILR